MNLSIVATLYQSAPYISEFYQRVSDAAKKVAGDNYEIVLVNDGSPDNSLDIAVSLSQVDPHLVVLDLSRNFGHHKAMMCGLEYASGDLVFLIDSDLEENPSWLLDFKLQMDEEGCDVVYGVQSRRKGNLLERFTGYLYYRLFRFFTGVQQPDNIVTARLMTSRYVESLVSHQEREINIGGLWVITGFSQSMREIKKLSLSPTSYSMAQKFGHFINAITSFSNFPLVFTFYTGLILSASSLMYILVLALRFYFVSMPPTGYTSLIVSIWFFSGLLVFFMGVQGIYISKIFSEVKRRPNTIIKRIYNCELGKEKEERD